ncbi:hypothetical protein FB107DRAFT_273545 [Schizophyllum commune]
MNQQLRTPGHRFPARTSLDAQIQAHAPLMRQRSTGSLSESPHLAGDMMDLDGVSFGPQAPGNGLYDTPRSHFHQQDGTTPSRMRYERTPTPHSDHGLSRMLAGAHGLSRPGGPVPHIPSVASVPLAGATAAFAEEPPLEKDAGASEVPDPIPAAASPQAQNNSPSANVAIMVPCFRAAADRGLGKEGMERLVEFTSEQDLHVRLDLMMVQLLVVEQRQQNIEREMIAARASSEKTQDLVQARFELTKEQMAALRRLIGHMAAQPLPGGYGKQNFVQVCMDYISNKRSKYGFKKFVSDETIKSATEAFLNQWVSNDKSEYRKELFKLIEKKLTLDDLVAAIMKMVHLTPRPATYDTSIYAFIALFRKVAMPLIPNSKGTRDTKYWKKLDAELASLVDRFGTENLQADCWRRWMSDIIADDRQVYQERGGQGPWSLNEDDELSEPDHTEDPEESVIQPQ